MINIKYYFTLCLTLFVSLFSIINAQDCGNHTSTLNNGEIKVTMRNKSPECFKVKIDGINATPNFTRQVTFYTYNGAHNVEIEFENGETFVKKTRVSVSYKSAIFNLKKNRKGEYKLKLDIQGSEVTEEVKAIRAKNEQNLADMEAKRKERDKEFEEFKAKNKKKFNQIGNEETKPNESGIRNSNNGKSSSISTDNQIVLKIQVAGKPEANADVTIRHGNVVVGQGTTDGQGIVKISKSNLISRKIDVYVVKGSDKWNLKGAVMLDDNYYALVDPTKMMDMMMKQGKEFEKMGKDLMGR